MTLKIGSAAASDTNAALFAQGGATAGVISAEWPGGTDLEITAAASDVLLCQHRSGGAYATNWRNRALRVVPIRVQ